MFYLVDVEDYVRVEPKLFGLDTAEAVKRQLGETYTDFQDRDLGDVIDILEVLEVKDGIIIPGDGAAYYKSCFKLIVFKPELQELVFGKLQEITSFGAFIDLGISKGMIHISQTMDDYVSFSKTGSLTGKDGKRNLNVGDRCLARVVAISFKGDESKIGLTMRQPGLGKIEWLEGDKEKAAKLSRKTEKTEKTSVKKEKKKNG